ncbi:MAG TPA: hypothetical protein VMU54_03610 [Planctomycetota bacterium]|nr:hypothetical protein [Planctomycetota bacterium]
MSRTLAIPAGILAFCLAGVGARADTGDPQLKTDHPWYPGELSCSTFERLFATQAELYKRVTGRDVATDEDKALASWYWRNLNYAHAIEGPSDYFGKGFEHTDTNREYWRGLFASGFGVCYTTHAQWAGEMERLLGHCRARAVTVSGHTSHEVFLTGGPYGEGRWVLLDHDISTVVFDEEGSRLLSIREIKDGFSKFTNPRFKPERQHGWRVAGLHDADPEVYSAYKSAMYEFGYSGPPPLVHLRSGETLRKYPKPGLDDGQTFVFWGMSYSANTCRGPERDRTWVNQPEKMYRSVAGTGSVGGLSRYGNAVYGYAPDFKSGAYQEGVVDEDDHHVTFEFYSPYVIACTPSIKRKEGEGDLNVSKEGATNGLVVRGRLSCPVSVSIDQGKTWKESAPTGEVIDLTDRVKGCYQYFLRFDAPAKALADSGLLIRTVCQTNQTLVPHLKDGMNKITYSSSGTAFVSAGPNAAQAQARLVDGQFGSPTVSLELAAPRSEKAVRVYAAAHLASGSPPSPETVYQIDVSTDAGKTWAPVVKDWRILRRGDEPDDFWSQSFCYGEAPLGGVVGPVRVRFSNSAKRSVVRAEAHLVYQVSKPGPVEITFAWTENGGELRTKSHLYAAAPGQADATWDLATGEKVDTRWVEYQAK